MRKIREWSRSTVRSDRTVAIDQRRVLGRRLGRWLIAVPIGIGCGLIGPYGTYLVMPDALRMAYWTAMVVAGFVFWWGLEAAAMRLLRNASIVIQECAVVIPFAITNSAFVLLAHHALKSWDLMPARVQLRWTDLIVSHVAFSALCVLPLVFLVRRLVYQVETRASRDAIDFLTERVPPKLRGAVPFALAAEGHYVRVHTAFGSDLITMKFEDALAAVVGIPGLQTHRSWWVALDQIRDVKPLGSAYQATLVSGLTVPVSRRRKAELSRALGQNGGQAPANGEHASHANGAPSPKEAFERPQLPGGGEARRGA